MEGGRQAALRGVLFTDMVGSSELRARLGDDRADALRRDHYALLGDAVTAYGGRVLRWTGDGIKADFPTASDAVAAALEMQRAVTSYRDEPGAVAELAIRIGVSVGEVVVEGNEAHGIAVIEAARLEPMAAPGEILATDLVARLGRRRVEADFEAVGAVELKGIDQPVDVVRVVDRRRDRADRIYSRTLSVDRRFPLVGRAGELRELLAAWSDAQRMRAAATFVCGPSGIGKSRLVAHLAQRAHDEGATVLAGSCNSDLAVPYEPFALAFAEAAGGDDELHRAVVDGAGPLGALFPSRRGGVDDLAPSDRYELFEAVVGLVDRLADDHPVVLVLEDLHWAAAPTVQLLRHLLRRMDRSALLVVASLRRDEVPAGGPLEELLADPAGGTTVALAGLDTDDVVELVATRVPAADRAQVVAFARRLHDESAGSPLFACELLHHLDTSGTLGDLVAGDATTLPLPDSVRAVVEQRLAPLPDDVDRLFTTAAVIGATFDLELLAAVTGRDPVDVLDACEVLTGRSLVREVDAGRFGFAHAVVRTTVLDRLGATRLALVHRRVAEALEGLSREDHDDLAHHWMQAGEVARANTSLERAAERDLDALAYESAAERYQALLDYHGEGGDERGRARAWLGLGRARRALLRLDYLDAIRTAGRLGRRLRDPDIVTDAAAASVWPGNFFVTAGQVEESLVELGEDALGLIGPDDPRRVRVLATMAVHLAFDPDRERRVRLLHDAEDLARRHGDPALIGTALVAEFVSLWDPTTAARRTSLAAEIGRMGRAADDVELEFSGTFLTAVCAAERGEVAEARRRLEAAQDAVIASQNAYFGFLTERLTTSLDLFTGGSDLQARIDDLAARHADSHADTAGTWAVQTGYLALGRGTLGDLVPTMREMSERSAVGMNWAAAYALALAEAGDDVGARDALDRVELPTLDFFWLTTMQIAGEAAVLLGDAGHAARIHDALLPHRDLLGITASGSLCFGLVATTLGGLALTLDDPGHAVDLLEGAAARAEAMEAPYETVRAQRRLATAHLRRGRTDAEVRRLIEAATATAAEHGFEAEQRALAELTGAALPGG